MSTTVFPPQAENVQAISDVPLWTESFHGSGYDPDDGIGVFVHIARAQMDPLLWDETFVAFLPGDRFLVHRGFGYGETPAGPAANALRYVQRDPFESWHIRFEGAVRDVTGEELSQSTVTDDSHVKAVLDIDMRALGPVYGIGGMSGEEFWAHSHYEQHLSLRGHLEFDGSRIELNGTGMRDHSVGPRDINSLDRHTWCHGEFPDGRLFMVMDVAAADGTNLRYAVVGDRNGLAPATLSRPGETLLSKRQDATAPYQVNLDGPDGPVVIEAEILQSLPLSMRGTNDWVPGTRPDAHHLMYECQTRFTWDGQTGYGLTERSVKD